MRSTLSRSHRPSKYVIYDDSNPLQWYSVQFASVTNEAFAFTILIILSATVFGLEVQPNGRAWPWRGLTQIWRLRLVIIVIITIIFVIVFVIIAIIIMLRGRYHLDYHYFYTPPHCYHQGYHSRIQALLKCVFVSMDQILFKHTFIRKGNFTRKCLQSSCKWSDQITLIMEGSCSRGHHF